MGSLRIEVMRGSKELAEAGIDAFCREPMSTSTYLSVMESFPRAGRREARHLVAYDGGEAIAFLPCYLQHTSLYDDLGMLLLTPGERRMAGRASRAGLFPDLSPALVCSCPEAFYCRLAHRPGIGSSQLQRVASALIDALPGTGRSDGVDLVGFINLRRRDDVLWEALLGSGYLYSPRAISAYLPVAWPSFDGYRLSMRRNRRKSMKSEWSRMRRAGLETREAADVPGIAEAMERVIGDMWGARGRPCPFNRDYYSMIHELMGAGSRVLVGTIGGRMLGFTLLLSTPWEMCAYQYGGLPEEVVRDSALYFNLCFNETIRHGIKSGVEEIRYGPTALAAKVARGCATEELGMFIRCLHARHLPAMKAVMSRNRNRRSPSGAVTPSARAEV